jgi:hypothetical protein
VEVSRKRAGPLRKTAKLNGSMNSRIFVMDQDTKIRFLVDTDADVCVFPRTRTNNGARKNYYMLYAANGTKIATYGDKLITLNLRLRRSFSWRFIIANVENPIIGMDFLAHYNLLVDARNKTLIDGTTKLTCQGQSARTRAQHQQ